MEKLPTKWKFPAGIKLTPQEIKESNKEWEKFLKARNEFWSAIGNLLILQYELKS